MSIPVVQFVSPVPIVGTSQRADYFATVDGWTILETDRGIVLSRVEAQNRPAIPPFRVRGVGYGVPEPVAAAPILSVAKAKHGR